MGILEQVIRMKEQGSSDRKIISELSEQGISPKEINDALRQAQIKYAVSKPGEEEMQPSIMPEDEIPSPNGPNQEYTSQGYEPEQYAQQQEYSPAEYQPQEQYAPQEQYYQPGGYEQYAPAGMDADTIVEISDQIFSDRIKKIQKQVDNLTENSALSQTKMENVSERLKKIETIIDKLQIAILEKVGGYGRNLESIKKEMSMMQDSFSKMISPSKKTERKQEREISPLEEEFAQEENQDGNKIKRIEKPQKKISKRK